MPFMNVAPAASSVRQCPRKCNQRAIDATEMKWVRFGSFGLHKWKDFTEAETRRILMFSHYSHPHIDTVAAKVSIRFA